MLSAPPPRTPTRSMQATASLSGGGDRNGGDGGNRGGSERERTRAEGRGHGPVAGFAVEPIGRKRSGRSSHPPLHPSLFPHARFGGAAILLLLLQELPYTNYKQVVALNVDAVLRK